MDGVLQAATLLCMCKLVCSFSFLPSLTASNSPVSFCCCCLLMFTDFVVTVFLSCLCLYESWVTDLAALGDLIALHFLLFLSHTYGAVLLLTTPLIAVETLSRQLWPLPDVVHRTGSLTVGADGQHCCGRKETVEQKEKSDSSDKDKRLSHVVGYLCCLSVWVVVALNVRWRWKLKAAWCAACLHTTNSFISCLPNLFSPMLLNVNSCWSMAFVPLLVLLLTTSTVLHRRLWVRAQKTHKAKCGVNNKCDSCCQNLVIVLSASLKPVNPGMPVTDPAQSVDPEKTESSCSVHRPYFWNRVQMSTHHHGDFVLSSSRCLSAEWGGQEHERTERSTPLLFITEERTDSQYRSQCGWQQWGFPCLGVNVMIGFVGVLCIFVLPLNLSVNILLIRAVETLLELCLKSLLLSAPITTTVSASHNERHV